MADRLGSVDAAFLQAEESGSLQHVGTLLIFDAGGLDHATLLDLVARHLHLAPRYRQLIRTVPGRLAHPVWVDDPDFDLRAHVRATTLVEPAGEPGLTAAGGDVRLQELVARVMSRPLDRGRPLWEMHLIEGLPDGGVAVLTKSHHVLVDGVTTLDLGQLILGADALRVKVTTGPRRTAVERPTGWVRPAGRRTRVRRRSVSSSMRSSTSPVSPVRSWTPYGSRRRTCGDRGSARRRGCGGWGGGARRATAAQLTAAHAPDHAVRHALGHAVRRSRSAGSSVHRPADGGGLGRDDPAGTEPVPRLFATVDTSLADHRAVRSRVTRTVDGSGATGRRAHTSTAGSSGPSINDVVLTTICGALRTWLQLRGDPVAIGASVRAVVPVSVLAEPGSDPAVSRDHALVSTYLVDLPVGEPSPAMRLLQIGYATQEHRDSGRAVDASSLVRLPGFAPPTLHALGARVASTVTQRTSHLVITNVPGPQTALHVGGARLLRSYPVTPLPPGQAVSIGVTSYDGGVYYGLYADRATMPDVERLGQCITDSLAELVEAAR